MGDSGQGSVLSNQVQAVKAGAGISIAANGIITVDSQTVVGVMKLGQTPTAAGAAYNGYNWPTVTGTAGQQITIASVGGGITTLAWADPDQIPWTAKGQLVVGTGVDTQTILNVGTDGQILIADSGAVSGLSYSSNYVSTTGATGAANIPAGTTAQQPASPNTGALRYNSNTTSLEFWNGLSWETVASSTSNSFVEKTSNTGSAVMPVGTVAQRDSAPSAGFMRFNDDTDQFEFWNGASWQTVASSSSGAFVSQTVPTAGTPSAVLPPGSTAQQQATPAPVGGYMRFNNSTNYVEFHDGTRWVGVSGGIPDLGLNLEATNSLIKAKTPTVSTPPTVGIAAGQAISGSMYWDVDYGAMFVRYADANSSQWVMINGSNVQTGTLDFPASPLAGATYAAPNGLTYTYDGTKGVWTCPSGGAQIGLGLALNGGFIKVSIPVAATPPTAGTAANQAMDGSMYWDSQYGALFVRYADANSTQWVMINGSNTQTGTLDFPATPAAGATYAAPNGVTYTYDGTKGVWTCPAGGGGGGGGVTGVTGTAPIVSSGGTSPAISITAATTAATGSVQLATAAENAAGTDATKAVTPAFSVPKDASGMTGAAILPSGTTAQQPGTLVAGMTRYNTTTSDLEFYTGTAWNGVTAKVVGAGAGTTYDEGASLIPGGTNAQRPATPSSGMFRWNTDTSSTIGNRLEVYDLSVPSWRPLAYATPVPAQADFTAVNGQALSGEVTCRNFTIPAGVTVTISGSVSIRATGNAIIAGTVNGSGTGTYGPSGYSTELYSNMTTPPLPGAGIGGGAGNTGGNEYSATVSTAGSSGASGVAQWLVVGNASAFCAAGGNSGSTFLLRASTINVTGTISCNGQDGQSAYVFACPVSGAGGGSGGTIILDADGTCSNAGTISANGGNGSNGYGLGVLGGGGGGGGQVIVQSRFGTATLGTTSVTGGVAGTQAPGPYTASGGGGGGNGGPGGNGFSPGVTAPPLPGGAGVAQTFGSPLPA